MAVEARVRGTYADRPPLRVNPQVKVAGMIGEVLTAVAVSVTMHQMLV